VLQTFDGGPGQIAIHGTNHPELIGKFVSNGCVRLNNDDITALQSLVSTGTPVQIVA
jgi:lipoprotein-anchoring transpeptidase ErfK/SrfK